MKKYYIQRFNRLVLKWETVTEIYSPSLKKAKDEVNSRMRHDKTQIYRCRQYI